MLPIRTILHATDFSDQSAFALRLACALARDYGARLIVLHVAVPPTLIAGEALLPPDPEILFQQAREGLAQLEIPDADVRVERQFETGDPVSEVIRVARDTPADLIVIGTHGRTGWSRLLMGSVAELVVRKAPCPVLTVKMPHAERTASAPSAEVPSTVGIS